jgi:prolyl oligopeptidase
MLSSGLSLLHTAQAQTQDTPGAETEEDPYPWLEDVDGERALTWVRARNAETVQGLAQKPGFETLNTDIRKILDSSERIPYVTGRGGYLYNFWRDATHPRGLWRRTTLAEYRKPEPAWDVLLDLDALATSEQENWVWRDTDVLATDDYRHVLISLSRGGGDAGVIREYDLKTRSFVKDGFNLREAKSDITWIDQDSVLVATDFGPGSMTTSGYARIVKRWQRGSDLATAPILYEARTTDMSVGVSANDSPGSERQFVVRRTGFFDTEFFVVARDGKLQRIDVPSDVTLNNVGEWLLIAPQKPWQVGTTTYAAGSLLVTRFNDFMAGKRELTVVYEPTPNSSLAGYNWTRHQLILNVLEDVKSRITLLTPSADGWKRQEISEAPANATLWAYALDKDASDDFFMTVTGYVNPPSLYLGSPSKPLEKLKESPAFFDTKGLEVSQHFATSRDGTRIPYFQVSQAGLTPDGSHPTLMYGYGGFGYSQFPTYAPVVGKAWLARGGVYVMANIRGGNEYGPGWHQAVQKENRPLAYEDFAAVAEDLLRRGITSPQHLGASGASNGGLLVGNMLTKYPQLFGAIVCEVPLLDMRRYTHLSAGASWIAEYGDPDKPEEWAYLKTFSPYQNLVPDVHYPATLFTTSTRDDRVHPAHARKMMARMQALGADVLSYENVEGGHSGAANNEQGAFMRTLAFSFLWSRLQ